MHQYLVCEVDDARMREARVNATFHNADEWALMAEIRRNRDEAGRCELLHARALDLGSTAERLPRREARHNGEASS
jgi:hypothetical protein